MTCGGKLSITLNQQLLQVPTFSMRTNSIVFIVYLWDHVKHLPTGKGNQPVDGFHGQKNRN